MTVDKMNFQVTGLAAIIGLSLLAGCNSEEGETNIRSTDLERISQAAAKQEDRVTVQQLAEWIIESRQDYKLVDIRDEKSYESGHIKDAVNKPLTVLATQTNVEDYSGMKVVVYSNGSENSAKAVVLLRLLGVDSYLLSGGYNAWQQKVLNPDIPEQATDDEILVVTKQRAISCYFQGPDAVLAPVEKIVPADLPKPAFTPPVFAPPADSGGLILDEGC
jgi:rhodanese-related sulfurtransferase